MGVKSDLFDFLVNLPATEDPDERKALVIATGYPNLGIYLDWQGAPVKFFAHLLDVFGRREQSALVKFLEGMDQAPQVSDERKPVLAELRAQVAALDAAGWQQEFATAAGPVAAAPPPDPAMLATSVITQVLTPYYKLGAAEVQKRAGAGNAKLSGQLAQTLEKAFAGDASAGVMFDAFKKTPDGLQGVMLTILRTKLLEKPALANELTAQLDAAAKEPGGNLELLIDVSQTIGTVESGANVIGAALGGDLLGSITAKIVQKVDVVKGNLTGATVNL